MVKKKFGPGFFLLMLYPFKASKLHTFLAQLDHNIIWENRFSLICDVISVFHSSMKQELILLFIVFLIFFHKL